MLTSDIFTDEIKPDEPIEVIESKPGVYSSFAFASDAGGSILPTGVIPIGKFGGTGVDGILNVISGTTTIDLGAARVFEKNYRNITIASGATLTFSNPNANGTVVIFLSQGNFNCSGTITMGATGAVGGTGGAVGGNSQGQGGGGGASMTTSGAGGVGNPGSSPAGGNGTSSSWIGTNTGGGGGTATANTGGSAGITAGHIANATTYIRFLAVPGSGGGGGNGSSTVAGGNGGRGGGALYVEAKSGVNFTGSINAAGTNGSNGGAAGGGGGGGGGAVVILYNILLANSGTITVTGGTGGTNDNGGNGGVGGAGYSTISKNNYFS